MKHIKLDYLTYFLDAYWNQMADEVYGTISKAAAAFSTESAEYRRGLLGDLKEATKAGLLGSEFTDPAYSSIYWTQFQRYINKGDVAVIRSILEDHENLARN